MKWYGNLSFRSVKKAQRDYKIAFCRCGKVSKTLRFCDMAYEKDSAFVAVKRDVQMSILGV